MIAALALGLLGDIGLMLSNGRTDPPFLAGLGAFLLGHIAYIVAFTKLGLRGLDLLAGGARRRGHRRAGAAAVLRGAARSAGRRLALHRRGLRRRAGLP